VCLSEATTGNNNVVVAPPTVSHVLAFQRRVSEMFILWTLPLANSLICDGEMSTFFALLCIFQKRVGKTCTDF